MLRVAGFGYGLPAVCVSVLSPTGSGSARSDGPCDLSRPVSTSREPEDSKVIVLVKQLLKP